MDAQELITMIGPAAQASAMTTTVPASFTVAQAAPESGWGESLLARRGKNLFGVKADQAWHGDVLILNTREFSRGAWVTVPAPWRKYATWQACMDDHAAFLHQNRRYERCFACTSGAGFVKVVANAWYATDPQCAAKLVSIIDQHQLARLDGGG